MSQEYCILNLLNIEDKNINLTQNFYKIEKFGDIYIHLLLPLIMVFYLFYYILRNLYEYYGVKYIFFILLLLIFYFLIYLKFYLCFLLYKYAPPDIMPIPKIVFNKLLLSFSSSLSLSSIFLLVDIMQLPSSISAFGS